MTYEEAKEKLNPSEVKLHNNLILHPCVGLKFDTYDTEGTWDVVYVSVPDKTIKDRNKGASFTIKASLTRNVLLESIDGKARVDDFGLFAKLIASVTSNNEPMLHIYIESEEFIYTEMNEKLWSLWEFKVEQWLHKNMSVHGVPFKQKPNIYTVRIFELKEKE
jgi:hypothetical protein